MNTFNKPIWNRLAAIATSLVLLLMALPAHVQARPLQAIALRGAPTTATVLNNSSLTINAPAGLAQGDLLIAEIVEDMSVTDIPAPAGWTALDTQNIGFNFHPRRASVFYRLAGNSEPASYTFTVPAGAGVEVSGAILAFSGVHNTTPFDVVPGSMTATVGPALPNGTDNVTDDSIETLSANALVLMLGMEAGTVGPAVPVPTWSTWTTATSPGALTEILDYQGTQTSLGAAWAVKPVAGETGQATAHLTSPQRIAGYLLALRPDTAVATDTNLKSIPASITYGTTINLQATVAPVPPDGELVNFYDGTTLLGSGALSGGAASYTTTATQLQVTGGAHVITAKYVGDDPYTSSSATRSVTVNPKTITITGISANNKVYDATTTATLNLGGAVMNGNIDGVNLQLDTSGATANFTPNGNVGNGKTVQVAGLALTGSAAGNYSLTQPSLSANITELAITVTADAKGKVVGSADPPLTYTSSPLLAGSDTFSGALTRVPGEAVGSYAIQQGTLSAGSNYSMTYVGANLNIVLGPTDIDVRIGGDLKGTYNLSPGGQQRVNYTGLDSGPVVVNSTNTLPIIAAIRDAWYSNGAITSFSQIMGLPAGLLSDTYYFPAYNNVTLDEQIRFGNVGGAETDVTVTIGGVDMGTYHLLPSEQKRVNYPGVDSGPVVVHSTGGVKIIAAIRDAWYSNGVITSFTQLMGLPASRLSDTYYFPAYNNVSLDEQLRFGNVGNAETDVTVTIGGVDRGTYHLAPSEQQRVNYTGLDSGPVVIKSSGGVKIIAAMRDAWSSNGTITSFSQLMGLPAGSLSTKYVFPAYNNVTLDEQLRFGNVGTNPTDVTVTIGGVVKGTYHLLPAEQKRINYAGLDSGPVVVESSGGVPIIAAIREAWTPFGGSSITSFTQLMGLPAGLISHSYYFPAYNNVNLDEQLRFGIP